jgi:hypothetical protein
MNGQHMLPVFRRFFAIFLRLSLCVGFLEGSWASGVRIPNLPAEVLAK